MAQQPCVLCGRKPSEAHHIRFVQPRALGRKASDEFAVPLCRSHHRAVHRAGDEKAWWQQAGIDPLKIARKLWKLTRMHEPRVASAAPTQDAAAERPAASGGQGPSETSDSLAALGNNKYAHRDWAVWRAVSHRRRHRLCRHPGQ